MSLTQRCTIALIAALLLNGCSNMPENPIDPASVTALAACPSSPNCVSSQAGAGDSHFIAPIRIEGDPTSAWKTLQRILPEQPRFEITASSERYLRTEATTRVLRFTDDVEFLLDRHAGLIHMRSASRVGYSDMGTNRRRLQALRERMIEAGAARLEA